MIARRFPAGGPVTAEELLRGVSGEPDGGPLRVGDERITDFLKRFSRALLKPSVARQYPELASLGFFLRPAEIAKTVARMADSDTALRFPRPQTR